MAMSSFTARFDPPQGNELENNDCVTCIFIGFVSKSEVVVLV